MQGDAIIDIKADETLVVEARVEEADGRARLVIVSTRTEGSAGGDTDETPLDGGDTRDDSGEGTGGEGPEPRTHFPEDIKLSPAAGGARIRLTSGGAPLEAGTRFELSRNGEAPISVAVGADGTLNLDDLEPADYSLRRVTEPLAT